MLFVVFYDCLGGWNYCHLRIGPNTISWGYQFVGLWKWSKSTIGLSEQWTTRVNCEYRKLNVILCYVFWVHKKKKEINCLLEINWRGSIFFCLSELISKMIEVEGKYMRKNALDKVVKCF